MEEKILVYVDPARHTDVLEWIARWTAIAPIGPRSYAMSLARGEGYLHFDDDLRVGEITFDAGDNRTEPASLAHLMWLLSLAEDLVRHDAVWAIVIGAKDDIDSSDVVAQARHAAAWYPETLLGDDRQRYFKVGSFRVSPYAPDHLTTFMTPSGAAEGADREVVATMNAFMARQREESARRLARAETIAGAAMRRLREGQGRDRD